MGDAKKLISNSSIVFVGTIVGSFFSYIFNMLVGRMLGPEYYGEFTAILSLTMILSVASGAIMTVTMKYSSELFATKHFGSLYKLYKVFSRYALSFAIFLFLLCLILVKPIGNFLSIKEVLPIIIATGGFLFGFLMIVSRGVLQGSQRFLALSITGALEALLKLLLGILLIKIGLGVSGAMLGVVLATVVTYFVTIFPLRTIWRLRKAKEEEFVFNKKDILSYTLPAFLSALLLIIAINIDILLVKHYFSATDAGIYAAISTIAKIVLYATAPIVSVMFPMISEKTVVGDKHYKLFFSALLLTLVGSLVILGIYYAIPGTVIRLLYGDRFVSYYTLLPGLAFFVLIYALISLIVNYFLVIKSYVFIPVFAAVLILQSVLIAAHHSTLENVIKILISTSALLFALLFGYYLITKREQIAQHLKGKYES